MQKSKRPGLLNGSGDSAKYHLLDIEHSFQTTPGPLGYNDSADPAYHLIDSSMIDAISPRLHWEPDPHNLLLAYPVNPDFSSAAAKALDAAVYLGMRVRVTEVYRSPERSQKLYNEFVAAKARVAKAKEHFKKLTAEAASAKSDTDRMRLEQLATRAFHELKDAESHVVRAAPAWESIHNYALAMDVLGFTISKKGKLETIPGSSKFYQKFAGIAAMYGIMWPALSDDRGHFEYHPKWAKAGAGPFMREIHAWAVKAVLWKLTEVQAGDGPGSKAAQGVATGAMNPDDFKEADHEFEILKFVWWAAGASSQSDAPPPEFLEKNPVPKQK